MADENLRDHGSWPAAEQFTEVERRFRNAPLRFYRLAFVHSIDDNGHEAHGKIEEEKGGMELVESQRSKGEYPYKYNGNKQIEVFLEARGRDAGRRPVHFFRGRVGGVFCFHKRQGRFRRTGRRKMETALEFLGKRDVQTVRLY